MDDRAAIAREAEPGSVGGAPEGLDLGRFRRRSLHRGVNPFVYLTIRALFVPFFLIYLRMKRIGRDHIPRRGPLILASNHRSFLDPFVIGTLVRRPVYYMAKRELFEKRLQGWILNALGAFPVDRGTGDSDAMETARAILARGDCVVIFPEGTRTRTGGLGVASPRASGGSRLKRALPWCPSPCSEPRPSAVAGASARARCACGPGARCASPRSQSPRPRSLWRSPSACGPA